MWNSQRTLDADAIAVIRMMYAGRCSAEEAAAASGLTLSEIRVILASCPQARLQEVEHTPSMPFGRALRRR